MPRQSRPPPRHDPRSHPPCPRQRVPVKSWVNPCSTNSYTPACKSIAAAAYFGPCSVAISGLSIAVHPGYPSQSIQAIRLLHTPTQEFTVQLLSLPPLHHPGLPRIPSFRRSLQCGPRRVHPIRLPQPRPPFLWIFALMLAVATAGQVRAQSERMPERQIQPEAPSHRGPSSGERSCTPAGPPVVLRVGQSRH